MVAIKAGTLYSNVSTAANRGDSDLDHGDHADRTAVSRPLGHRFWAWKVNALRILNAALVLSADHELNPATFAARIAASCEADLHSCVAAAICAHSGTRIARACDRLEEFFSKTATSALLLKKMIASEKTSRAIAGRATGSGDDGFFLLWCVSLGLMDRLPLNRASTVSIEKIEVGVVCGKLYVQACRCVVV